MVTIRDATEEDLAAIFAIYDEQVLHGTATFDTTPKTARERREWFHGTDRARYCVLVGEEAGRVVGWARLYPWSPRRAYDRTAENAVYVHKDARGRGVGRALLGALLERARGAGVRVVIARVAEGNPASLALHRAMGFTPVGTLRRVGEKFGRVLDVDILQVDLDRESPGHG